MKMIIETAVNIQIDGKPFTFIAGSEVKVESGGYDLYITEPGFDETSEKNIGWFTSKSINISSGLIESAVKRTSLLPCSKVFIDKNGKKRLYTYFD